MEWTRSETLALAMHNCTQCHGCGLRLRNTEGWTPCNCVLRAMFRICYDRFRRCTEQEKHLSRVSVEPASGSYRPMTFGRKDEEYMADFCLVSRRNLSEIEHRLFRYHFPSGRGLDALHAQVGYEPRQFLSCGLPNRAETWPRVSGNCNPIRCFRWTTTLMGRPGLMAGEPAGPKRLEIPARPSHLQFPQPVSRAA